MRHSSLSVIDPTVIILQLTYKRAASVSHPASDDDVYVLRISRYAIHKRAAGVLDMPVGVETAKSDRTDLDITQSMLL